ncbi:MBL fold metallo-hydrolase [Ktedonobacteria bacterium brp13]|nr:MBL fold metallo-hydrolase [Ktedonobacteria bacterium brp13]
MTEFTLHEIVPGVQYASGGVCNRGIIADQGDVLVIDTGISVAEGTALREAADKLHTHGSLIAFNTHPHLDHVFGNEVFRDSAIIAHEGVRENLVTTGAQTLAGLSKNPQMAERIGPIQLTPPTVTFDNTLTIHVGAIEVHFLYFGIAHSPSDSVAWLPQSRTLFTGDLLFNALVPATPPGGSINNWIQALEKLEQLGAEHVISGHGPSEPPTALGNMRTWFELLRTRVNGAIKDGLDRDATIARVTAEMQAASPRASQERYPMVIGGAFDQYSQA